MSIANALAKFDIHRCSDSASAYSFVASVASFAPNLTMSSESQHPRKLTPHLCVQVQRSTAQLSRKQLIMDTPFIPVRLSPCPSDIFGGSSVIGGILPPPASTGLTIFQSPSQSTGLPTSQLPAQTQTLGPSHKINGGAIAGGVAGVPLFVPKSPPTRLSARVVADGDLRAGVGVDPGADGTGAAEALALAGPGEARRTPHPHVHAHERGAVRARRDVRVLMGMQQGPRTRPRTRMAMTICTGTITPLRAGRAFGAANTACSSSCRTRMHDKLVNISDNLAQMSGKLGEITVRVIIWRDYPKLWGNKAQLPKEVFPDVTAEGDTVLAYGRPVAHGVVETQEAMLSKIAGGQSLASRPDGADENEPGGGQNVAGATADPVAMGTQMRAMAERMALMEMQLQMRSLADEQPPGYYASNTTV
ncbi:hypothetical protein GGX14DRAFT_547143 [Mycena pura]|uniref:Uncharacterized protein n=1 Tax=Mycena pura TaxID=153505 RepID=A0AAD6Y0S1_9AGAR|nr:hypothetical protein GGX14DRAFT_547143 [Mycena pura]